MCKQHKISDLSIAVVSIVGLIINFIFPHIALASVENRNSEYISFKYEKNTAILANLPIKISFNENKVDTKAYAKKDTEVFTLPLDQELKLPVEEITSKKIKIVVASYAKKVDTVEGVLIQENDEIARGICLEAGITDLPCWQDLKAMRNKESFGGKVMTGDNGRSRGWYHIQTKLHRITDECAMDFACSTEWTVNNLVTNGYKINRAYAISRHNGGGVMAQNYAKSVMYNSAKFQ